MSKGSKPRPFSGCAYTEGWERVYRKPYHCALCGATIRNGLGHHKSCLAYPFEMKGKEAER
jgi:hypothetical protein